MKKIISLLLIIAQIYGNTALAQTSHIQEIKKDRAELIKEVIKEIEKSDKFKKYDEIQQKQNEELWKLYTQINSLPQPQGDKTSDTRKIVAQSIGFSTGVLGVIKSIWSIHVRKIGLKNKGEQIKLRHLTKDKVMNQIKRLEEMEMTEENTFTLNGKIETLEDINQKIGIDMEGIKNMKAGLTLDYFSVATSVGIFVLTLTIDPIIGWWNDHFQDRKTAVINMLNDWDKKVTYSSVLGSSDKEQNKFLIYLADNDYLKLNDNAFEEILWDYKAMKPNEYNLLRSYCKGYIIHTLDEAMGKYNTKYEMDQNKINNDGTYVRHEYPFKK